MAAKRKPREFKFRWLDLVMAWDHAQLGRYKSIAYALVCGHMFSGKVVAYPGLPTLARSTGMSQRSVSTGLDVLEECGLIGRQSGGGKGISTTYWLAIPCNILQGLEFDTLQSYAQYLATVRAIPCKNDAQTLQLSARETEANLILKQIKKQGEPAHDRYAEENDLHPASDEAKSRSGSVVFDLPIATLSQRASWGETWPAPRELAGRAPGSFAPKNIVQAKASIAEQCWFALGYNLEDAKARKLATGCSPYEFIREYLKPEWVDELGRRFLANELTLECLANVLASLGIEPKQADMLAEQVA